MDLDNILAMIDSEIARLKQARVLLAGIAKTAGKPGTAASSKPKRKLSAVARKKIAAAQRRRWAEVRKAATRS